MCNSSFIGPGFEFHMSLPVHSRWGWPVPLGTSTVSHHASQLNSLNPWYYTIAPTGQHNIPVHWVLLGEQICVCQFPVLGFHL